MSGYTTTITPDELEKTKTSLSGLSDEITTLKTQVSTWLGEITNSWDDEKVRRLQEDYKSTYEKALTNLKDQIDNFKEHILNVQTIYAGLSDTDY